MDIKDLPQPLGFFHVITNADALHYGYWPDNSGGDQEQNLSLTQAQAEHSKLILQRLPQPPAKILDVGCGLGLMAGKLHQLGYQVTAIAPSEGLIAYAEEKHPGPCFINCGFLDDQPEMQDGQFDVLLFQESLQYFPDLDAVFHKAGRLLAERGRLIVCDEVSYNEKTMSRSAVHHVRTIEQKFAAQGFYVQQHESMGTQVTQTCVQVLAGLAQKKQQMLDLFGNDVEEQIDQLVNEWQNLLTWYQNKVFGYELWELRFSPYRVRGYQPDDEQVIIEQFNQVFGENRQLAHWQWKYSHNPQGGPCVSAAWEGAQLASHYSAYPLPLTVDGQDEQTYHVGDTFTVPAWRGVGRGKTNLLSRVVRHFHKSWCEGQIDFFYGFNTGRIQKLGKKFLSYVSVAPVYEYTLSAADAKMRSRGLSAKIQRLLKGYRIELAEHCDDWADQLFAQAKNNYAMSISRHKSYLQWRYDQHPDYYYQYVLLRQWGKVVGWCVTRKVEQHLLLIDAFCLPQHSKQLTHCLQEVLLNTADCTELSGWFSNQPSWWSNLLLENGFKQSRQCQNLDLCATFFSKRYTETDLAEKFYFTMGDSDLF